MSKKVLIILIIVIVSLLLFFSKSMGFAQRALTVSEKFWILCPKNLAVFHILVMISPSGEKMKDRYPYPLNQEARQYFNDFKNHPAVQQTDNMFKTMWYFPFNFIAFYYNEFPEAKLSGNLPPEEWKYYEKMISDYLASVRDFYLTSKFEDFWTSHQKDIQALMKEVKDNLPSIDIPRLMEDFYGRKAERFYYVLAPFMASSFTHVEMQDSQEKWSFYHIDGGQDYSNSFANAYFAFHEFSHCFVEPVSKKYAKEINALAYLYQPLKRDFQSMGYRNWDRAFNEHLIHAGQLHLTRKAFGEERAEQMMERETKKGFKLLRHFYNWLKNYDENREKNKDLSSFYPEILSRLSRFKVEEYRKPDILGFYPEFRDNKLFIKKVVPDTAFQKAGFEKGDVVHSIAKIKISSEEDFKKAMEKKNRAKEGESIEVVIVRSGQKIKKLVPVPFINDYRYTEKNES